MKFDSTSVIDVSSVNPLDRFISGDLSALGWLYKTLCGAIVAVVALHASDWTKSLAKFASDHLLERVVAVSGDFQKGLVRIGVDIVVLLAIIAAFVAISRILRLDKIN